MHQGLKFNPPFTNTEVRSMGEVSHEETDTGSMPAAVNSLEELGSHLPPLRAALIADFQHGCQALLLLQLLIGQFAFKMRNNWEARQNERLVHPSVVKLLAVLLLWIDYCSEDTLLLRNEKQLYFLFLFLYQFLVMTSFNFVSFGLEKPYHII